MKYRTRPGIVYTKICGVLMLIPTRATSEDCPEVMKLNILAASVWEAIDKNMPLDKTVSAFSSLMRKPEDEIRIRIDHIIQLFLEKGFILQDGDESR